MRVEELVESLDEQVSGFEDWLETQADGFKHPAPQEFHGFLKRLQDLRVKDVMRGQVLTCTPDAPAPQLAEEMVRHHVHRIIVVEDERPVGIVSSLDLTALVAGRTPK